MDFDKFDRSVQEPIIKMSKILATRTQFFPEGGMLLRTEESSEHTSQKGARTTQGAAFDTHKKLTKVQWS